jgi:brefeldin A-resistance guanine nucleotide exchange factor 1
VTALFRATVAHPEASKVTLELVQKMATGAVGRGPSADNYLGIVEVLDEFSTSAGAAASRLQVSRRANSTAPAATL